MADQAQPLAAHVLLLALTDEVPVPAREAVDAAPANLLFHRHEAGDVMRRQDAFAPFAKIESRDEVDLHRSPYRVRARRLAIIMIGDAADDAKADTAHLKKFQRFR